MRILMKQKRIYLLLLFPISILLVYISRYNQTFIEHVYSLGIYRVVSQLISNITGILPFSLAELTIVLLPFLLIFLVLRIGIKLIKKDIGRKTYIVQLIINSLVAVAVTLFAFLLFGGLNYYRYSFTHYSNLEVKDSSVEELYDLTKSLALQANQIRDQISESDENGVFRLTLTTRDLAQEVKGAFENLSKEYLVLGGYYGRPKPIMLSSILSYTEITGIFIPFTMEANVNMDIPDYTIPVTMLHEMAHQRGFMREDEANFIAYLAGMESDHLELQYSSTMLALVIAGNALYDENKDLYFEARDLYNEALLVDIRANTLYWSQFEDTTVSVMSNKLNDTYLKVNAQEDGVKSYGRMIDLLLAKVRSENSQMKK